MGKNRPRYNEKARASSNRSSRPHPNARDGGRPTLKKTILVPKDTNADVVVPGSSDQHEVVTFEAEPQSKMSSKKRKRMEKYIEKKLKKDARGDLYKKIEEQKFSSELLQSSRTLGKSKETKKERLRRALLEERMGIEQSDTSISLYKDKSKADDAYEFDDYDDDDDDDNDDDEDASGDEGDGDVKMKPAPAFNLKPATDSVVYDEGYNPKATSAPLAAVSVKPTTASTAAAQGSALKSGTTVLKKAAPKKKMSRLAMIRAQKEKAKEVDSDSSFNSSDSQYDSSSADEDDESDDDGDGKAGEGSNEEDNNEDEPTKKKRRGWVTEDGEEEEERIISNIDSLPKDSGITLPIRNGPQTDLLGNRVQKIKTLDEGEITKAFHVAVNRLPEMQEQRLQLPVCADEQYIMESIRYNDIVIIKGETGSGKTTQVPQFLYEAGYGHADSPNPGMIGITQPRRVAAVSMADRVAKELNLPASKISHQIRYDATTTPGTVMKFMTDGVLLRELNSDFLLRKYSVIIIDEAHERSLNTDILIGALSRIVRLRREESKTDRENTKPLKVIIMSATLAIEEFTRNERLFGFLRDKSQTKEEEEDEESSSPSSESEEEEEEKGEGEEGLGSKKPKEVLKLGRANKKVKKTKAKKEKPPKDLVPVVSVDVKKVYGTTMHFNKKTPDYDYITEAFRKVSKIHTRLPEGGILVFLSGQQEITTLVKRLRKKFPFPNPNQPKEGKKDEVTWMTDRTKGKQAGEGQKQDTADSTPENQKVDPRNEDVELEDMAIGEAEVIDDGGDVEVDDEVYELDGSDSEEELLSGDEVLDESPDAGTAPLYVLPLYSLLKTEEQMKVFQPPPEGARICVVATNVAETSITIPNIKYVVDSGKAKERHYDKATGIQTFQVGWTSKASAIQRAGRAGRTSHGHCYRLYSSAVYENEFPNISEAEIHKMPIDGVVLQMKSMHIDNVVNFPFPTPPDREDLKRAEHRLIYLNALDKAGKKSVTELGKTMSIFPLTPRLAKMLTLAHQENCFPYIIAIVAAMSVGEVFVNEYQLDTSRPGDTDDESEEEEVATRAAMLDDLDEMELQNIRSSKELQRQQKKAMRRKFYKAQSIHEGLDPLNDMAKILNVVGAYARETNKEQFCTENFVRFKAMQEIHQLRGQLTRMVQDNFADLPSVRELTFDPFMPKPTARQMLAIRQIVACSFVDQVAIRKDLVETVEVNYSKHATQTPYVSMWSKEPLYIHPASGLYGVKPAPDMVIYQDLQKSVQQVPIPGRVPKTYLKGVTVVEPKWMPTLANHTGLVRASKERIIKIDDKTQKAVTDVTFGPKDWPLPPIEIWQRREGARYVPMSKTEIRDKKLDIRRKLNR